MQKAIQSVVSAGVRFFSAIDVFFNQWFWGNSYWLCEVSYGQCALLAIRYCSKWFSHDKDMHVPVYKAMQQFVLWQTILTLVLISFKVCIHVTYLYIGLSDHIISNISSTTKTTDVFDKRNRSMLEGKNRLWTDSISVIDDVLNNL